MAKLISQSSVGTMKLTGPRYEQYQTLRSARKYISAETYASTLKTIERAQRRAEAAAAVAEANRIAREAAKEAERVARRKAAAAKAAATRAARKAARIPRYVWHYRVTVEVQAYDADKNLGPPFPVSHEGSVIATEKDHATLIKQEISEWIKHLEEESDVVVVETYVVTPPYEIIKRTQVIESVAPKTSIKMKEVGALQLDGEEQFDFDTGNSRCVFDWLIYRYGGVRGCKKLATLAGLTQLFGADALAEGVSCDDLVSFCDAAGCRMYALDETQKIIKMHTPEHLNTAVPPLVFRVKNQHIYPIVSEARAVSQYGNGHRTESAQVAEKDRVQAESVTDIVVLESTEESRIAQMVSICKSVGVEIFNRDSSKVPITFNDDGLQSFTLCGVKYFWDHDDTVKAARSICSLNNEDYHGEHVPGMLAELVRALKYDVKSSPNPHVNDVLRKCKDRAHYGLVDDLTDDAWACDIAKCYSACVTEPMEDWLVYDSTAEFAAWDGELKAGLYFVQTDDMTLFHGSNLYSLAIIQEARANNIPHRVIYQLRPSRVLARTYYAKLLEAIAKKCHNDASLMKFFINIFVGTLGRTSMSKVYARMDTDANTVFTDFNADKDGEPFIYAASDMYVYGRRCKYELSEHNVPQWIQVLDQSNIRLFRMIKESGGRLLGRKTDCAILSGGSIEERGGIGSYRLCDLPKNMKPMRTAADRSLFSDMCEMPAWMHLDIHSSSEVEAARAALAEHSGLMINGRAGTGKSYMALKLAESFNGTVIKTAFTNKAALRISGQTIHKTLKINAAGKFCLKSLKQRIGRNAALFIVDEMSMVSGGLWRMLCETKKALPGCKFVLLGDNRQLGAVGETIDFFESSMVKYLAGGVRIELTEKQRYDQELWDLAEAICTGSPFTKRTGAVMNGRHICYLNATRKKLNAALNEKRGLFIEYTGEEEAPQDAWVYAGLPVIAARNHAKGDDIYCVNAEPFTVVSVGERIRMNCSGNSCVNEQSVSTDVRIRLVSQRPDGEHFWDINIDEFHTYFVMNFAATVHKSQGETLTGPITIWDSDRMDHRLMYTAVTRATSADLIWWA